MEVIDPETGEIIELGEGEDALFPLANRAIEASEQAKAWESRKRWLCAELKARQEEDKAVYGGAIKVSKVANPARPNLNREAFRARIEDLGLEEDEVWELLFAATSFDPESVPPRVLPILERCTERRSSGHHVRVSRVLKPAPVVTHG